VERIVFWVTHWLLSGHYIMH